MEEYLVFETINCDGEHVMWRYDSRCEIQADWLSDECPLPAIDDELVMAYVRYYLDFTRKWYHVYIEGNTFGDLVDALVLDA